jgi:hypothetical protein
MILYKIVKFSGNQMFPINPTIGYLYPTVTVCGNFSIEANFGDNAAKPFCYDINKCSEEWSSSERWNKVYTV